MLRIVTTKTWKSPKKLMPSASNRYISSLEMPLGGFPQKIPENYLFWPLVMSLLTIDISCDDLPKFQSRFFVPVKRKYTEASVEFRCLKESKVNYIGMPIKLLWMNFSIVFWGQHKWNSKRGWHHFFKKSPIYCRFSISVEHFSIWAFDLFL